MLLEGALVVSILELWKPDQREEVTCSRLHNCQASVLDSHSGRLTSERVGKGISEDVHEDSSSAAGERAMADNSYGEGARIVRGRQ